MFISHGEPTRLNLRSWKDSPYFSTAGKRPADDQSSMTFSDLGLKAPVLKAVAEKGYTEPSPIQAKAIPEVLDGQDVIASAQTGTGKTAGFTLPMIDILSDEIPDGYRRTRALILTPTRELAAQIQDNILAYSKHVDLKSTVIFGGVNQHPQVQKLRKGVDILVATPGRLLDLESQGEVFLNDVEFMVLDEADRMLDMGFIREIRKILAMMPENRQNLLFSATFSKEIKELAKGFMYKPVVVEATPENTTVELINQRVIRVDKRNKRKLAIHLIKEDNWQQALIFTRTKHGANRLAQQLTRKKISAAAIHGDKTQNARTAALKGFKDGKVRILVATDIAARGLDIPLLPYVLNLDLPNEPEAYVHRIGRTGRAGAGGEAISFCSEDELEYLQDIEKLTGLKLNRSEVPGFEVGTAPALNEEELKQIKANQNFVKKQQNRNKGKKKTDTPESGNPTQGGNSRHKKRRKPRNRKPKAE